MIEVIVGRRAGVSTCGSVLLATGRGSVHVKEGIVGDGVGW